MNPVDEDYFVRRIKVLSERVWEHRCQKPDLDEWLARVDGRYAGTVEEERLHLLHLLDGVTYFGLLELRVLLKALFREHVRYPMIQEIRASLGGTRDGSAVDAAFRARLDRCRFVGVGNPAESGTHLLYYFRQENGLSRGLFAHATELLTAGATDPTAAFVPNDVETIFFVDDLCASGEQVLRYSRTLIQDLRSVAARTGANVRFAYLVLMATTIGLETARTQGGFDQVDAICVLDETQAAFAPTSRVFRRPPTGISSSTSEQVARGYGAEVFAPWPLGFDDGQLLLALHHNTPDNSLPVLWFDDDPGIWSPPFPRQPKVD